MTVEELISRQHALSRSTNRWSIFFLVVFFGVIFGNLPLGRKMDDPSTPVVVKAIYMMVFFGIIFGNIPLMIWFSRRQSRVFGLGCPNCGKPLTGVTGQVAVATGKCGLCGSWVTSNKAGSADEI